MIVQLPPKKRISVKKALLILFIPGIIWGSISLLFMLVSDSKEEAVSANSSDSVDPKHQKKEIPAHVVAELESYLDEKDYRQALLRCNSYAMGNLSVEAYQTMNEIIQKASAGLKISAEKLISLKTLQFDPGGFYTEASTKSFKIKTHKGETATVSARSHPEIDDESLYIDITFYSEEMLIFLNSIWIGTEDQHIEAKATCDTKVIDLKKYKITANSANYAWNDAENLAFISDLPASQSAYVVVNTYHDTRYAFEISEEFRESLLALLDYKLASMYS